MAIVRLGKSTKGVHFIDDRGVVYVTSTEYIKRLLDGKFGTNFVLLTRLPNLVSVDRFPASPVWNPDTGTVNIVPVLDVEEPVSANVDALSNTVLKKVREVPIKDVVL